MLEKARSKTDEFLAKAWALLADLLGHVNSLLEELAFLTSKLDDQQKELERLRSLPNYLAGWRAAQERCAKACEGMPHATHGHPLDRAEYAAAIRALAPPEPPK